MATKSEEQKDDGTKNNLKTNVGSAVIGCLLRNKESKRPTFAIVNRHVTKASKGSFFLEKDCKTEIARNINNSSSSLDVLENDVDLVELTEDSNCLVQPVYRNIRGKITRFSLYEGTVQELENANLFQCFRPKGNKETISRQGRVLQKTSLSKDLIQFIDSESNFIVGDIDGKLFAEAGDSGRVVAREVDGQVKIVGVITWGQYQCRDSPDKSENTCISICMLLKNAIRHLNKKYNLELSLLQAEVNQEASKTGAHCQNSSFKKRGDDNRVGVEMVDDERCVDKRGRDRDEVKDNENEVGDHVEPGQTIFFLFHV